MTPRPRLPLLIAFLLVAAVCARLGFWQVGRLRARRAANAAALAARNAPEVNLKATLPANDGSLAGRRVRAVGHYDHEHDIVLRGRVTDGAPGVYVVSPLLLGGSDTAVLVERGFVPAADAVTADLDSLQELGRVRIDGIALPFPAPRNGGAPLARSGRVTWERLDRRALGTRLPYPIVGVYVRQTPAASLPAVPQRLPPPPLDDGPHLTYAIQWFIFAAMALAFGGVILWNGRVR